MSEATETHWRLLYPTDYLAAPEFKGKDVTLTIKSVSRDELPVAGSTKKERKVVIQFTETPKKLVTAKTNAKTIAGLLGVDTARWVGQRITLFPTTCKFGPDTVDCVRVRPTLPKTPAAP